MKILIPLLILIFVPLSLAAQEDPPDNKGWIGLRLGAALPTGDFGTENGGDAGTGFNFTLINFGYKFHPNIGLNTLITGSAHASSSGALVDFGNWVYGGLLLGLAFRIR